MISAIYSLLTGEILSTVIGPPSLVLLQKGEGEDIYIDVPDDATHIINGEPVTIARVPTVQERITAIVNAVQRHLDLTARTRNYDGILSLCSYATSTDAVFSAEGQAGVEWRDACWRTCYQGLAEVEAGARAMPTPEEAVAALPPMVWP